MAGASISITKRQMMDGKIALLNLVTEIAHGDSMNLKDIINLGL